MKYLWPYATLFVLLCSSCILAENSVHTTPAMDAAESTIELGAEDSWPPYSDKYGQGISTNIVNAAFRKVGITPRIQVRAYARVLQDVKTGVLDGGYNVTRQRTTETEFIFGAEPLLKATAYWYFPATKPQQSLQYQSIESLPDGTKVGGIIDYEYGDIYESQRHRFKEIRVSRQTQLIRMLQLGRINAAIMFEEEANQTLKDMALPENTIERGFLNHTSDIYVAFSRKNANSVELAKKLDRGLVLLKVSGEYDLLLSPKQQAATE